MVLTAENTSDKCLESRSERARRENVKSYCHSLSLSFHHALHSSQRERDGEKERGRERERVRDKQGGAG